MSKGIFNVSFLQGRGYVAAALLAAALLTAPSALVSCSKAVTEPAVPVEQEVQEKPEDEIVFLAGDFDVETKASTGTAAVIDQGGMPSINVSCTVGAAGSETAVWTSAPFTLSGGMYSGGKYWTIEDKGYHFYASNAALTHAASGARVAPTNTTDVVVAWLADPNYKQANELVFEHVFARLGQVTVTPEPGYTLSNVKIELTPRVSGKYDIRSGRNRTDATGWSEVVSGEKVTVASSSGANANDVYLVPGEYTVTASWDATLIAVPSAVLHYTGKTTNLTFAKGKINKFTAILGGEMVFGVELAPWGTDSHSVSVDQTPLTFDVVTSGTILWKASSASIAKTIEYSKTGGTSWTSVTSTTSGAAIAVSAGDKVLLRGNNAAYGDASNYNSFAVSGGATFRAYGNVTSLLSESNRTSLSAYALKGLFKGCTAMSSHPYLKLQLPSTGLATGCYESLFEGCTGLTVAPELRATAVAASCYKSMFKGCTGLKYAPDLVATTLATDCYNGMFQGCTSLTASPELPAAALVSGCYVNLFNGCSSLRHIKALFTTAPTAALCGDWTKGVAATGSFFKSSSASWNVTNSGSNYYGIPAGWTVVTVSE